MILSSQQIARTLWELGQQQGGEEKINFFLKFLHATNQELLLKKAYTQVKHIAEKESQHQTLVIQTKHDLSKEHLSAIKDMVNAPKDVDVSIITDELAIGSFKANYRGLVYDGTLATTLTQMKRLFEI